MLPTLYLIGGSAAVALLVGGAGGYKIGISQGEAERKQLEQVNELSKSRAQTEENKVKDANARIEELSRRVLEREAPPAVEYVEREVYREIEGPPLPPGACATDKFAGMLDVLSGAQRNRERTRKDPSPRVSPPTASTVAPAIPRGYISAERFRWWAASSERQYRSCVQRDKDWYDFVLTIPNVEVKNGRRREAIRN